MDHFKGGIGAHTQGDVPDQGADSMRLAAGLHRIGSDVVNVYLVEDAAGSRSSTLVCLATGVNWNGS
jgi:hypothetical protein